MKNYFKPISIVFIMSLIALSSCSKKQNYSNQEITKPDVDSTQSVEVKDENFLIPVPSKYQEMLKTESFVMDVSEGFSGKTKKGMKISIPKDALVDENGNPITGSVDLEIQEFYSAAEIMVSNIPMGYMEGERLHHFESDGMFTINASQKGKQVKIADGKKMSLETVRSKDGTGFDFYALEDNQWVKDSGNEVAELTEEKIPVLRKPSEPLAYNLVKFNPNYYTIEKDIRTSLPEHNIGIHQKTFYDKNTVKQLNIDVKKNPWILDRNKWKFDKNKWMILKRSDSIKNKIDTVFYNVKYAIRGNKKFAELTAQQKEAKLQYEKDLAAYKENYSARLAAGQLTMAERTQELVVGQFGTYNIDRYYDQPAPLIVEKDFDISIPTTIDKSDKVFLVVNDGGTLIPVDLGYYAPVVRFNKKEKNALIVMGEDKVYAIDQNDFTAMAKTQMNEQKFDFQLKEELNFSTIDEFNEQLENLF